MKTEAIPVPDLKHTGDVKYEFTLEENKDYEFTMQNATFQMKKRETGSEGKLSRGLSIAWLAVPTGLATLLILFIGFLVGRSQSGVTGNA